MAVRIVGVNELVGAFGDILKAMEDPEPITRVLDQKMRRFAHVLTGFMKSTVYHKGNIAGADAWYAGFEAGRGGDHDFGQRAIDDFSGSLYLKEITRFF